MEYENLSPDAKKLVSQILDAAAEERGLEQQIKNISGGSDVSDVESLTLPEDPALIPTNLQRELDEKRTEIAAYMKEAVKMGISALPMIKNNYEKYVGEEMSE